MQANVLQQSFQPMTLPGFGQCRYPSVAGQALGETVADGRDGGLEPAEIAARADPEDGPTVRTAIPFKPQRLRVPIKAGQSEPVRPDAPPATGAPVGFLPGERATQFGNGLDAGFYRQYQ
jgi:hypothetical protein